MMQILFLIVFASAALFCQTTDEIMTKLVDSKYYHAQYFISNLASPLAYPGGAQIGILIRAEHNWPGGYVQIKAHYENNRSIPLLGIDVYHGARMGFTNSTAWTNWWVSNAVSNLGGCYTSNDQTTVSTIATTTNTNTNGNNVRVQCLNVSKSNNMLYSTIGSSTNNNAVNGLGRSMAVIYGTNGKSGCALLYLGHLVDKNVIWPSTNNLPYISPSYYLSPATYMVLVVTNRQCKYAGASTCRDITNEITNIVIDLEFTKR